MGTIIAVANQKGGVGKTTTAVNLCAALARRGKRVLLADCDPQGNATTGMGLKKSKIRGVYDVMFRGAAAEEAVVETKYGAVLGSNAELAGANVELVGLEGREYILKEHLAPLRDTYEYIFIDCPPSLELLTLNALAAADRVLVPVQCEFYALEGLSDLTGTLRLVTQRMNPALGIEGMVLTMFDKRTKLSSDVEEALREHFPGLVYKTVIPRSVRLGEAPSHGKPCVAYDKDNKGSKAYLELAAEFLKRQKKKAVNG